MTFLSSVFMVVEMNSSMLLTVALVALAVGGVAWVFLYPYLSGEVKVEKRMAAVAGSGKAEGSLSRRMAEQNAKRRQDVQKALKEVEQRGNRATKNAPLPLRIKQAGLEWTVKQFYIYSAVFAVVFGIIAYLSTFSIQLAAAALFIGGFGLPRWMLNFLRNRRQAAFIEEFVNAIDVIVRGVKSGLPLNDCIRIVANEAQEPVRSEFKYVVEVQGFGVTFQEALDKMYERVPLAEVNFLAIVIAIQQKAGGNLSEALGNLSKVLRERKKLKAKIKAYSAEAKASAIIIAAMPIVVMFMIYLTTPEYIMMLFTQPLGNIMLMGSAVWMFIGITVMRNMINFDF